MSEAAIIVSVAAIVISVVAMALVYALAVAVRDFCRALDRWENQRDKNED